MTYPQSPSRQPRTTHCCRDGYIVRVSAADVSQPIIFIEGGSRGVTLDAPKGGEDVS